MKHEYLSGYFKVSIINMHRYMAFDLLMMYKRSYFKQYILID